MSNSTETDRRERFVASLRAVADLIDNTPELRLPNSVTSHGMVVDFGWSVWGNDAPGRIAELARLIGGKWDKNAPDSDYNQKYYELSRDYCGARLSLSTYRESVCERFVVEWRRHPLLAEVAS